MLLNYYKHIKSYHRYLAESTEDDSISFDVDNDATDIDNNEGDHGNNKVVTIKNWKLY